MANGAKVEARSQGNVRLEFNDAIINLSGVLLVPFLGFDMVSIGNLANNGIESTFRGNETLILRLEESDLIIRKGSRGKLSDLYILPSSPRNQNKFKISKELKANDFRGME